MFNELNSSGFDRDDDFNTERPYNEDLVRASLQEKALFINTRIKAMVSQIDFHQAADIHFGVPLDIESETEAGISVYEMAIQNPRGFQLLIEVIFNTPELFDGIKPDIISAIIGTHRKEIFLTFDFFHTTKGANE